MGVLNVTPDSFSDGGDFLDPARALERALAMEAEGATFIDVGGESTRPGAAEVTVDEELRRVLPVVESLARSCRALVSVDTSRPEVIERVVGAGAVMINDVRALRHPGALPAVARSGAAACLMHMRGEPATMQQSVHYDDVVTEVRTFLAGRMADCEAQGIEAARVCVDPGFGFGKHTAHNLQLLRRLPELLRLGRPVMVGLSRKSMLRELTGRAVHDRLAGSVALATAAVMKGASIVRAHDVAASCDAVRVAAALTDQE